MKPAVDCPSAETHLVKEKTTQIMKIPTRYTVLGGSDERSSFFLLDKLSNAIHLTVHECDFADKATSRFQISVPTASCISIEHLIGERYLCQSRYGWYLLDKGDLIKRIATAGQKFSGIVGEDSLLAFSDWSQLSMHTIDGALKWILPDTRLIVRNWLVTLSSGSIALRHQGEKEVSKIAIGDKYYADSISSCDFLTDEKTFLVALARQLFDELLVTNLSSMLVRYV